MSFSILSYIRRSLCRRDLGSTSMDPHSNQLDPTSSTVLATDKEEDEESRYLVIVNHDGDEIDDDGDIYAAIPDISHFRQHCSKKSVHQLCEKPDPNGGFVFLEGGDVEELSLEPGQSYYHRLARDVLERYNKQQQENLELKRIMKLNYMALFAFMCIETVDKDSDVVRTYQLAVWDKEGDGHPVVGWFKDVSSDTPTSRASPLSSQIS